MVCKATHSLLQYLSTHVGQLLSNNKIIQSSLFRLQPPLLRAYDRNCVTVDDDERGTTRTKATKKGERYI
jgi:hypothetical protein